MANIKSAAKRARQALVNRARNRACRGSVGTMRRQLLDAIDAGNKAGAEKLYMAYSASLDKAVKKGILARNTADRGKSRLARRLQALA